MSSYVRGKPPNGASKVAATSPPTTGRTTPHARVHHVTPLSPPPAPHHRRASLKPERPPNGGCLRVRRPARAVKQSSVDRHASRLPRWATTGSGVRTGKGGSANSPRAAATEASTFVVGVSPSRGRTVRGCGWLQSYTTLFDIE